VKWGHFQEKGNYLLCEDCQEKYIWTHCHYCHQEFPFHSGVNICRHCQQDEQKYNDAMGEFVTDVELLMALICQSCGKPMTTSIGELELSYGAVVTSLCKDCVAVRDMRRESTKAPPVLDTIDNAYKPKQGPWIELE
jgi:hypothetical protein